MPNCCKSGRQPVLSALVASLQPTCVYNNGGFSHNWEAVFYHLSSVQSIIAGASVSLHIVRAARRACRTCASTPFVATADSAYACSLTLEITEQQAKAINQCPLLPPYTRTHTSTPA